MGTGNFSNGGRDTFDALKQNIGIRLQQGVPLLDRDWNELEDIRRHYEQMLRLHYLGNGVPEEAGFRLSAPGFPAPGDFVIGAGRCVVGGFDVWNPKDLLFSEQPGGAPLVPAVADEELVAYLLPGVVRVTSDDEPALRNRQDVNIETCVRDRLTFRIEVRAAAAAAPAEGYALARLRRPAGTHDVRPEMITDLRRTGLNLAQTVERLTLLQGRMSAAEGRLSVAERAIEDLRRELARLFWNIEVTSGTVSMLFGGKVAIRARVLNGLGEPIQGATLAFSTDWGSLDPAMAVTDREGRASVELLAVAADVPPPRWELGVLEGALTRIEALRLPNPGSIPYARVRLEPQEMAIISRYSPANTLVDLGHDLPADAIVAAPRNRTVTVTIHAKEGPGSFVRGSGSIQVQVGHWVRDWARTKLIEVVSQVAVGDRVGALMGSGRVGDAFDTDKVRGGLAGLMQDVYEDTGTILGSSLFVDARGGDDPWQAGTLGQAIANEANTAVGAKTNHAIARKVDELVADDTIPQFTPQAGKQSKAALTQTSSQIAAGFAQKQKQLGSGFRLGL